MDLFSQSTKNDKSHSGEYTITVVCGRKGDIVRRSDVMAKKRQLTPFGKEVKHRLIELNMTQVELAELVGTSKQYLGKILFGERAGTMYLEKINQVLHME